ncbi:hypothetical protein [Paenibacillus albidus]|nr:hypothetical protein [Paenibacillus albidus]
MDFTTDYVCIELKRRNLAYFRINLDEMHLYDIELDLQTLSLTLRIAGQTYVTNEALLKSVYYRAPIYLRDTYKPEVSADMQLYRNQWMAFLRNLSIFENAKWVNDPTATFKAENKLLQLIYTARLGFTCPSTKITNTTTISDFLDKQYIVKSVDTAVLQIDSKDAFVYSNVISDKELLSAELGLVPIVIQEYVYPKIDVRVTVVGNDVFAVRSE